MKKFFLSLFMAVAALGASASALAGNLTDNYKVTTYTGQVISFQLGQLQSIDKGYDTLYLQFLGEATVSYPDVGNAKYNVLKSTPGFTKTFAPQGATKFYNVVSNRVYCESPFSRLRLPTALAAGAIESINDSCVFANAVNLQSN